MKLTIDNPMREFHERIEAFKQAKSWDELVDEITWFLHEIGYTDAFQKWERQLENLRDLTEPLVFHYVLLTAYKGRFHRGRSGRDRAARLRAHQERAWWKDEILTYLDAIQDFRRRGNLDEASVQQVFLEELDPDFFETLHARLEARCHPPFVLALCGACANPHREEGVRLRGFLRSVNQINNRDVQQRVLSDLQVEAVPYPLWSRYHPSRRPLEMLYHRSGRFIRVTGAIPRITPVPGHKLHW